MRGDASCCLGLQGLLSFRSSSINNAAHIRQYGRVYRPRMWVSGTCHLCASRSDCLSLPPALTAHMCRYGREVGFGGRETLGVHSSLSGANRHKHQSNDDHRHRQRVRIDEHRDYGKYHHQHPNSHHYRSTRLLLCRHHRMISWRITGSKQMAHRCRYGRGFDSRFLTRSIRERPPTCRVPREGNGRCHDCLYSW